MSTRANIVLYEVYGGRKSELLFYRHSDGYPKGTMPTLEILSRWIKQKAVRNDLLQVAGWLIIIGAMEYNTIPDFKTETIEIGGRKYEDTDISTIQPPKDWKCGAYQPTTTIHGDIEWIYRINVQTGEIEVEEVVMQEIEW